MSTRVETMLAVARRVLLAATQSWTMVKMHRQGMPDNGSCLLKNWSGFQRMLGLWMHRLDVTVPALGGPTTPQMNGDLCIWQMQRSPDIAVQNDRLRRSRICLVFRSWRTTQRYDWEERQWLRTSSK
jgi:hypothetical protein